MIGPAADAVALPAAALQAAPVAAAAATVTLPDLAALKTSLAKEDDTGKLQAAARKDDDAKAGKVQIGYPTGRRPVGAGR